MSVCKFCLTCLKFSTIVKICKNCLKLSKKTNVKMVKNCQQLQISDLNELLPDQWFTMVSISCQTNSSIYGLTTKSFGNKTLEMPKQMFHFRKRTFYSSTRIISSPKVCFQRFSKDPCHKKAKRMVSQDTRPR